MKEQFEEIWKKYPTYKDVETINKMMRDVKKQTIEEVEHKHQVSMQCARDGMNESYIEILKKNKTLSHKLKQNLIDKLKQLNHQNQK